MNRDVAFETRIGTLAPQRLENGACGMFLWSRAEQPRLVFFSANNEAGARMVIDRKEVLLARASVDGKAFFGQFTTQEFEREDLKIRLTVEIEPRAGIIGGAVVSKGALRLQQDDGWEFVMPVGGLLACESP